MNKILLKKCLFVLISATTLISGVVACDKNNTPPPTPPTPQQPAEPSVPEETGKIINGTEIDKSNTLIGLISDRTTKKGIPGVPVTDGYTFTVTDENGVYQFKANSACRNVYYTLPSEYKVSLDTKTKLPLFYSTSTISPGKQNRNDFLLEPLDAPEKNFTFLAIGDPQCKTNSDVNRFRTETIPDMKKFLVDSQAKGKYNNVYVMTMGDITFDNTVQWKPMRDVMSRFTANGTDYIPFFNTIGNHDHDASKKNQYESTQNYIDNFGPVDYSFNRGDVHIIVMDNVLVKTTNGKTWTYSGGISAEQLKWLRADLALVKDKQNKMVFFCAHIPFRGSAKSGGASVNKDKNYAEVLKLLTEFHEAHLMIGHTHYPQNWIHTGYVTKSGKPIYEHVHGAACGAWWSCNMNTNGAPNGYSLYEIEGNSIKNWVAKGTKNTVDYQMRVYDGNQIYGGSDGNPAGKYKYTWYDGGTGGSANIKAAGNSKLKGAFVAAIWNDDDTNWKVEFFQDGKKVGDMKRVPSKITDICVASYFFNKLNKNTTTWTTTTAQHYWYISAPGGDPTKVKNWEVRATQTIPSSGQVNVYTCNSLQTDYSGF